MLSVKNIYKYYGAQTLFSDISFGIGSTEKIGLIGRNGTGKTTLLKIILGEESADMGSLDIPPNYRIAALTQHLSFTHPTALQTVCAALPPEEQTEENTWKAKSILMGLGFQERDFEKNPTEFSGGFQVRIRLAESLVSEPDLLLLDEPTNYLDILSLRWLEGFLKSWKKSFLLVTHDALFMEKVVESTLALHRGKIRKMKGGPLKIMDQIKQDEEVYEKTRQNQEKKQAAQEEFIRTFRAGARSAGLVQSRIKALEKQELSERLEKLPEVHFRFRGEAFKGNVMMEAKNISIGYEGSAPLLDNFSCTLNAYDKLAIIGANGKGKTTLLNTLCGKKEPITGQMRIAPTLEMGYLGSESFKELRLERTLLEEVVSVGNVTEQEVRKVLGSLLFSGETVKKKIKNLSGGEKTRACLAKILLSSHHLLVLDEPTNHLDMESCLALCEGIAQFAGAVLMVSHDERILEAVANRLMVFENGEVSLKSMGYREFLDTEGWKDEEKKQDIKPISENKQTYLEQKEYQKKMRQLATKAQKLEEKISSHEELMKKHSEILAKASYKKDYAKIKELGMTIKTIQGEIDEYYLELEKVMEEME